MKGVILAGGSGTRLRPATLAYNKHLALVYDRPMIYYPIQTLKDMGCTEIIIVSGGENIGDFTDLLKDGSEFGVHFTYRVQPEAGGIAQAISCVEGLVGGLFPVILGDNYFSEAPEMPKSVAIYVKNVDNPERFGVYDPLVKQIVEKPKYVIPREGKAVTGLYVFDDHVMDLIKYLKPSDRGEYEVTDINNWYLEQGFMQVHELDCYWSDMGTFDSLLSTAIKIKES